MMRNLANAVKVIVPLKVIDTSKKRTVASFARIHHLFAIHLLYTLISMVMQLLCMSGNHTLLMHVIVKTEDSSEESSTEIVKPDEIVIMLSFGHSWLSSSS